jgi:hypothetical protein
VTQAVMEHLCFDKLWERCQNPIPIFWQIQRIKDDGQR